MKNLLYDKASTLKLEDALKKKGISSLLLMTRAGFNIYQLIKNKIKYDQIIVLAGPGSNGGDAISFAIHAKINNENVSCLSLSNHKIMNSKFCFENVFIFGGSRGGGGSPRGRCPNI